MPEGWALAAPEDASPPPPHEVIDNKNAIAKALGMADFMANPLFLDVVLNNHSPIRVFPSKTMTKAEKAGESALTQKFSARGKTL